MLTVFALTGIPEVRPGDDLEALLLEAIAATPGVEPLTAGDVLVVTQKVVSKAEGAIVDLTGIDALCRNDATPLAFHGGRFADLRPHGAEHDLWFA